MYQFYNSSNMTTLTGLTVGKVYACRVAESNTSDPTISTGLNWSDFSDPILVRSLTQQPIQNISGASGVVEHSLVTGTTFLHQSVSGNFTANFTNFSLSDNHQKDIKLIIQQGSSAYMITGVQITGVSQTINWYDSTQPTGTISGVDTVSLNLIKTTGSNYITFAKKG